MPAPPLPRPPVRARLKRAELLFVCGKCLKRHRDGKAMRRALKRAAADETGQRRPRLVRTACLGLCPGRAVALAGAATLARGEVVVLAAPGEAAAAVAMLRGLSFEADTG